MIYYIKNYGGIELYNKNTKLKIDYEISHIESFKGNYAIFTDRCGLFGVIYKDGKIIFSPIYNHISMIDPPSSPHVIINRSVFNTLLNFCKELSLIHI